MTWVIKVLLRDVQKVEMNWNGTNFDATPTAIADFIVNDFQFSESTWREVNYSVVETETLIRRLETDSPVILNANSARFQFINPTIEEVIVVLPQTPKFNQRYILKNLSEINNKLLVKQTLTGPTLFTLDSLDEYANIFHDGVEYHISI